ncbi:MAG: MarR family winged helix-turn-helix transcriptional regulator [Geminicoccaceae bacterium]
MNRHPPDLAATIDEIASSCRATRARMASRELTRDYDAALAGAGLRSTELAVLVASGRLATGRLNEVAELLSMDLSTLSRAAAQLERKGWLRVDKEGHRTRRVRLTDEGAAKIIDSYPGWRSAQDRAVRDE